MRTKHGRQLGGHTVSTAVGLALYFAAANLAHAEIDGHGPDAWRVTGVAADDVLNAHMGPGKHYPVIESFAHNERKLQQVTCVPYYTLAHYIAMSEAELEALPPRWCLMRDAALIKAGWVAQRFIMPDDVVAVTEAAADTESAEPGDSTIAEAAWLVRTLYEQNERAEQGEGPSPLSAGAADAYFISDIVALLESGIGAHPLYGAQDFQGRITRIAPDAEQPMFRGMITINVDFTNFDNPQRAIYRLRADTTQPNAPLRIFRVEHEGWSYP
ncbi:MAG TPA: hypothetical protein GX696_08900 [Pseudomonadaceae bacterium]|nr:hypothetical protein [Pseudomonadaceae bacterium]